MARILVIEDEHDIQTILTYNLGKAGYQVRSASSGGAGLSELRRSAYDLVLLDLMLQDLDGLEVCRVMRAEPALASIPVIMVTAKSEESDVVLGLGLGADDYIVKPFRVQELLARVKVRLERRTDANAPERRRIQIGGIDLDPVRHRVLVDGRDAALTLTEFKLLHFLASHPGVVYDRNRLLDMINGGDVIVIDRTIDVHIRNLRTKLHPHENLVETVRGVGYRFSEDPSGAV